MRRRGSSTDAMWPVRPAFLSKRMPGLLNNPWGGVERTREKVIRAIRAALRYVPNRSARRCWQVSPRRPIGLIAASLTLHAPSQNRRGGEKLCWFASA